MIKQKHANCIGANCPDLDCHGGFLIISLPSWVDKKQEKKLAKMTESERQRWLVNNNPNRLEKTKPPTEQNEAEYLQRQVKGDGKRDESIQVGKIRI